MGRSFYAIRHDSTTHCGFSAKLQCHVTQFICSNFNCRYELRCGDRLWPSEVLHFRKDSWNHKQHALCVGPKHIVNNTHYISEIWEVERFLNRKIDLQSRLRSLVMMPFDIGHIRFPISLPLQLSLSCTGSEILSFISYKFQKKLKRSRYTEHIPFWCNLSCMH